MDISVECTTGYYYPNTPLFNKALRQFNKALVLAMPKSKYVQANERTKEVFTHTFENEFETCMFNEQICDSRRGYPFVESNHPTPSFCCVSATGFSVKK